MSTESDLMSVAGTLPSFYRILPATVTEGPSGTATFRARQWTGEPRVLEPDKGLGWGWWPLDALPDPTVSYTAAAIKGIRAGSCYTAMGWT
ncbi:hypothetical protein [Streptomyces sp. NPDC056723]|uniref:hypothetical protein n=1 Tax=Streptomyces sp. NPDC056723 TaxID=3345925 RepID=UPI00368B753D